MPSIVLFVSDLGANRTKAQWLLMRSFALGEGVIRNAIAARTPVVHRQLYDRQNPAFPHQLLQLMEQLEQLGSAFTVYELPDGQTYDPARTYYQITPDRLRNMIAAREESLQQQRRLGELEDGAE